MKILSAYLKDHRRLLAALLAIGGAAALLLYLYGLPLTPLLYTALVCAVIAAAFFVLPDFAAYRNKVKTLEAQGKGLLASLNAPAPSGPLPQALLGGMVKDLCQRLKEMDGEYLNKREDMLEYYTLWAHQIKIPLAAMRLILQSTKTEETPGEEGQGQNEALLQELFKVERYVEMVLGYLRLDTMSSDLRLESCSVYAIVKQAVRKFAPQFIYKNLSLELPEFHNQVITDAKWLSFVVEQLLSNALKYTEEGGVSISMDENDLLSIRDTGVGILPEDLPRIFERGFTGLNGRVDQTSTGLGLYLVKQVTDKLQNRVEIRSQPGQGTEARLYLQRDFLPPD